MAYSHRLSEPTLSYRERLWFATILSVALILMFLLGCGSGCAARQFPDEVPTMSDPAVAKLVKVTDGEESGYCTVFKVGTDLAMTAGHCCDKPDKNALEKVVLYHAVGPHAVPGAQLEILLDDDEHDVCIMRGRMVGAPLQLVAHDPAVGARVWTAGYPKTHFLITDGYWAGRDEDDDAMCSVGVWGGASGSPVMDSDSHVVGVLRAYYPPMSNMAILTPIEWLRSALTQARTH